MTDKTPPLPPEDEPQISERGGISQVGGPSRQNNVIVAAFGVVIVALLLFFIWSSDEGDTASPEITAAQPEAFEAPQRAEPPALPEPDPEPEPEEAAAPKAEQRPYDPYQDELRRLALRQAEEQRKLAEQRRRSPILIVNKQAKGRQASPGAGSEAPGSTPVAGFGGPAPGGAGETDEEQFAARVGSARVETVGASFIRSRAYMIPQGTMIRGVLETAIQSDLPGYVRATVANDVHSFDGSRLLIPKASRLIGQYKAGLVRGQTRLFVIWTRILRPDGASIMVGSPGTDPLGRAGLEGDLDTHFFKIFGASILLSLIDGAIDAAVESTRDQGDNSTTIIDDGSSLNRASEIALENSINIPPTIHIDQGTPIQVFVAKDLDFRQVELR